MPKTSASSVPVKRTAASATPTRRRKIDYSDIPALTPEQLRGMTRIGRPPLGAHARRLIAIRLDNQMLAELQAEAAARKIGYQTLIHEILTNRHARHAR
jgi:uncharacterized protein (DUF4415 family)